MTGKKYSDQVKNGIIIISDDNSDSTIKSGNDDEMDNLKGTKRIIKKKPKKSVIIIYINYFLRF
jgi:hypothetical protein